MAIIAAVANLPALTAGTGAAATVDVGLTAILFPVLAGVVMRRLIVPLGLLDALLALVLVLDLLAFFQLVVRVGLAEAKQRNKSSTDEGERATAGAGGGQGASQ
jgi:hypothetical protein